MACYLRHAVELHSALAADSAGSVFAERVGVKWLVSIASPAARRVGKKVTEQRNMFNSRNNENHNFH